MKAITTKQELNAKKAEKLEAFYLKLHKDKKVKNQADFCRSIGVGPTYYSDIISGKKSTPDNMIFAILDKYGYNIYDDVFGLDNSKKSEDIVVLEIPQLSKMEQRLQQKIENLSSEIKELKEKITNVPQQA